MGGENSAGRSSWARGLPADRPRPRASLVPRRAPAGAPRARLRAARRLRCGGDIAPEQARECLLKRQAGFPGEPRWYQIAGNGLAVIGSPLPPPRVDLRAYEHDVGVAWLWLAARKGTFGRVEEVISERRLRSCDGSRDPNAEPLSVRLGGFGPHGREKVHYPDLILRTADGRRVALELELSSKTRTRLEMILGGYGADPRFDGVLYLVHTSAVARSVQSAARRLGTSELVHIQRVRSTVSRAASTAALGAEHTAQSRRASSHAHEAVR